MASSLSFSDFNINEDKPKKRRNNRTIKKRDGEKVKKFLNSLTGLTDSDNDLADFNSNMENFSPPPQPQLTKQPEPVEENNDLPVTPEAFSQMSADEQSNKNYENYYNTYIPYFNKAANSANLHGSKDELMTKLNYMIHLLEENKDEKTNNVTEELVLYMFLGVFVIFVVDSFARAGKYTR